MHKKKLWLWARAAMPVEPTCVPVPVHLAKRTMHLALYAGAHLLMRAPSGY